MDNKFEFNHFTEIVKDLILVRDKTGVYVSLAGITVVTFLYLRIILVSGPIFMRKREPYNLKLWIRIYNIFQIIVCGIFVVRGYMLGLNFSRLCRCDRFEFITDNQRLELYFGIWAFLGIRILEYVETVFFILRKKFRQASFLHIYHHIGSVAMVWILLNAEAELSSLHIGVLNSFVHFLMYMYYLASSFNGAALRKFLDKIKPLITVIQLIQFVVIISHCVILTLPPCSFGAFFYFLIANFTFLFFLFSNFFYKNYVRSKSKMDTTKA